MNVHLETDSTLSLYFVFGLLLISLDWERDLHCWKEPNKAIDEAPFFNKTKSFRCQKNFSFTMQWVEILLQILVQIIGTSQYEQNNFSNLSSNLHLYSKQKNISMTANPRLDCNRRSSRSKNKKCHFQKDFTPMKLCYTVTQ